jgi:LAO/AO transport system kinase
MERLARDPRAFIRPSPSGGTLGGVARKTRETILVFEAAGYDVVLVETIGVGQSEITVRSMVDFFLLLLIPGGGDELQGIKKGVIELADAVLVNKADGDTRAAALTARAEYDRALHWLRPTTEGWTAHAHAISARTGEGVEEMWGVVERFREITVENGALARRRREQAREWLHAMVEERVRDRFRRNPAVAAVLPDLERRVMDGELPATRAAWKVLEAWEGGASR